MNNPYFNSQAAAAQREGEIAQLKQRIEELEAQSAR